ncbi:MAG: hypothetical protein R3B48_02175 [Kofleriaceae bacterium]
MSQAHDLTSISLDTLASVAGGAGNKDSRTTVLDGAVYERTSKERTDNSYRLDAIRQACDRQATTTSRGLFGTTETVDQAQAGKCFQDAIK